MHFNETKNFIEQLSKFRAVNDCNTFEEYVVRSPHLKALNIFAKSKTEAVKLAGLVLSHGDFVKSFRKMVIQLPLLKNETQIISQNNSFFGKRLQKYAQNLFTLKRYFVIFMM